MTTLNQLIANKATAVAQLARYPLEPNGLFSDRTRSLKGFRMAIKAYKDAKQALLTYTKETKGA